MATETFLSNWIIAQYILPFLFMFFIVFALLEKTEIFGEDRKQLNALVAFVIGLMFALAVHPKEIVSNLILFFTVSLVVIFVGLMLWGLASGDSAALPDKTTKIIGGVIIVIALFIAVLWATGTSSRFFDFLKKGWENSLLLNLLFIIVIAAAIAIAIKSGN